MPQFGRVIRIFSFLLFVALTLFSDARADVLSNLVPTEAKALGMGNTGISLLNDSYAMFYNPANLANKQVKPKIEPLNVQGDFSNESFNALASNQTNPLSLSDMYSHLKSNPGQWASHGFSVYPNITTRFASLGMLYRQTYSAKYEQANTAAGTPIALRLKGFREFSPTAALSFRLFGGVLKFGGAVYLKTFSKVDQVIKNPDSASKSWETGSTTKVGVDSTAGVTLTLPYAHLPTFSFVARNMGTQTYPGFKIPIMFDVGMGHTTYFGRSVHLRLEADHRDVTNSMKLGHMRSLFMGAELRFFGVLNLRGGYAQGYPSAGFGLAFKKLRIDFGWYSEEMAEGLRSDRNQRYVMQIAWSLFN